ncbi:hypothetical protein DICVIV_05612 [Dictyocaulus viviparus]|uniref:Uncharacterized protein n=1 Tax=Dictyocaulus viviparus TaxID=29172 RepID=A0A0D8XUM1_DICVI|nr:hypothetical protein DICVIV_05612 [Dictyocaulus viviparus]
MNLHGRDKLVLRPTVQFLTILRDLIVQQRIFATESLLPDDQYRVDSYGATDLNRHRFDDGFSYRKGLYEFERGVSPGPGQQVPASTSVLPNSNPPILNRFRQTTRRVISNGSDSCTHTRTRSMDRKQFGANDFACGGMAVIASRYTVQINAQPYSPEPVGDYTYVNFHDSLTGIASVTKDEKRIPKSILKNKQLDEMREKLQIERNGTSVDLEQRNGTTENFTRSNDVGNGGPVRSVIDRLRRHLSLEKSASPQAQSTILSERAPMAKSTPNSRSSQDRGDNSKKKRSLLSFTRRRTSEVHMGSDGKMIINGCDDTSNNKQSNSSFDKIKSLFRKSDVSNSSLISNNDCYSGRYTTAAMHDKLYSTNPSTNLSSSKDIYVPLYRRFPGSLQKYTSVPQKRYCELNEILGSTTRDSTLLMNRYSYTPGLTDQRRHYHDDHNIY